MMRPFPVQKQYRCPDCGLLMLFSPERTYRCLSPSCPNRFKVWREPEPETMRLQLVEPPHDAA